MTNSFNRKIPFIHPSLAVSLCARSVSSWTGSRASCMRNQMRGEAGEIKSYQETVRSKNAEPYSHTGPKIPLLIIQLQARGAQSVYCTGCFNVCSQILSRQMKERAAALRDGSPRAECMSTDYFLTSCTSALHERRAWSGKTRNKGFPNNTKSHIGASRFFHCYDAYSCSSSNFKHFLFCCTCPPANSMCSVVVRSREK